MNVVLSALLLFMLITTSSMFEFHMLVVTVVMLNILELIMKIVPDYPTIQKPNCRQFPELTMADFADALRPNKFTGVHRRTGEQVSGTARLCDPVRERAN